MSSLSLEMTIYLVVSFMCHIFLNDSSVKRGVCDLHKLQRNDL